MLGSIYAEYSKKFGFGSSVIKRRNTFFSHIAISYEKRCFINSFYDEENNVIKIRTTAFVVENLSNNVTT